jgi:uncharacterized protein (TIGR02145 family)
MKALLCTVTLALLTGIYCHGQRVFAALAVDKSEGSFAAWSYDYATLEGAEKRAMRECAQKGGNCTVVLTWQGKGCGAYRTIPDKAGTAYAWGVAATREEADAIATAEALKRSNGAAPTVLLWACSSVGDFKPIKSEPLPPAPVVISKAPEVPKNTVETKAENKPEIKAENKTEVKAENKPEVKTENKAKEKTESITKPVIDSKIMMVTVAQMDWTIRNLSITRFRNGDNIPVAKSNAEWAAAALTKQPMCRYMNDDGSNVEKYGLLYNWYAVSDPRGLAPAGFHIPTSEEWETLFSRLGDASVVAGKLKSASGWIFKGKSEMNGSDDFGFNALPGGNVNSSGVFAGLNSVAGFWSSSSKDDGNALGIFLYSHKQSFGSPIAYPKASGLSVRCVKD